MDAYTPNYVKNISQNQTKNPTESNEKVIETVLTTALCLGGFFGNILVAKTIITRKRMQTPTNWLVFNLSICCLTIVIVIIPYDLIDELIDFPFGIIGCKYLVMPVMEHFASVCVLTHTAVGLARYMTIRRMSVTLCGREYRVVTKKNVRASICVIWLLSFIVLSVPLMGLLGEFDLMQVSDDGGDARLVCILSWTSVGKQRVYRIFVFVLTYVIPTFVTGFSYYHIRRAIVKSLGSVRGSLTPDQVCNRRRKNNRMSTTFMTMYVAITVTTCPFHIFLFGWDFEIIPPFDGIRRTFDICLMLFYAQVVINPFVLFYMSEEFRREVCCLTVYGNLRRYSTRTSTMKRTDNETGYRLSVIQTTDHSNKSNKPVYL